MQNRDANEPSELNAGIGWLKDDSPILALLEELIEDEINHKSLEDGCDVSMNYDVESTGAEDWENFFLN